MDIDWDLIDTIIEESFEVLVDEFKQQQEEEIRSEKWEWDRPTYRRVGAGRTGKLAGSPRDIVDTGGLLNSLTITVVSPTEVIYSYGVDYAMNVYAGEVREDGSETLPRPWIDSAREEYDLVDNFANILEERLA